MVIINKSKTAYYKRLKRKKAMKTEDKTQDLMSQYGIGYIVTDLATQDQKVIQACRDIKELSWFRNRLTSEKNLRVYDLTKRPGFADFQYYLEGN